MQAVQLLPFVPQDPGSTAARRRPRGCSRADALPDPGCGRPASLVYGALVQPTHTMTGHRARMRARSSRGPEAAGSRSLKPLMAFHVGRRDLSEPFPARMRSPCRSGSASPT